MNRTHPLEFRAVRRAARWGAPAALALVIASVIVVSVRTCLTKPFWADEIMTVFITGLHSPVQQWRALYAGVDGMPPAFYLITGLFLRFPFPTHIDWRLPALAGFTVALFCVYFFVRRNNGAAAGLLAALLLVSSQGMDYASEARPYGLLLGATALAALCWQQAGLRPLWTFCLGLSLMAAVSFHHLAPVLVLCFALAETALSIIRKRMRWGVWAAFAASSVPALLCLPILMKMKRDFGQYFWSKPSLRLIPSYYAEALRIRSSHAAVAIVFLLLFLAGIAWKTIRSKEEESPVLPDLLLACSLVAFPVILVVFSLVTGGGFAQRYALPVTVGVAIAVPVAINWRGGFGPRLFTACFLVYALCLAAIDMRHLSSAPSAEQSAAEAKALKAVRSSWAQNDLPLVISSAHDYLVAYQYGTPAVRARLLHLSGSEQSIRLTGTDSASRLMAVLSEFAPVQVRPVDDYIRSNHSFLLLTDGPMVGPLNWLPAYLQSEGWNFEPLETLDGAELVLASDHRAANSQ